MAKAKEMAEDLRLDLDSSEGRARSLALLALEMKAFDLLVLDMRKVGSFTNFLVICTGTSSQHVESITGFVEIRMREAGAGKPMGIEGRKNAKWVLMDYEDVVFNVFDPETREFYELEKLWLDAPRVTVNEDKGHLGRQD